MKKTTITGWVGAALLSLTFVACKKDNTGMDANSSEKTTITVQNILQSKPLVESGTFQGNGTPLILPGQSTTIQFLRRKAKH